MAKGALPYRKPTKKELLEAEVKKNQELAMKTRGKLQYIDPTRIGKTFDYLDVIRFRIERLFV